MFSGIYQGSAAAPLTPLHPTVFAHTQTNKQTSMKRAKSVLNVYVSEFGRR